jgi:DNA-binding NarL/FixJ family response regulator
MAAQILVVDDNEVVRGRLSEALNSHGGWEVCAAVENGEQALVKARELNPDLIILDLVMPVMDGLRATREILRILPSVPIVIYTLHYAEWLVLETKKAGARGLVPKSDVARLMSVLEDLLQEKSLVESAPVVLASTEAHAPESRAALPEQLATDSEETGRPFKPD